MLIIFMFDVGLNNYSTLPSAIWELTEISSLEWNADNYYKNDGDL